MLQVSVTDLHLGQLYAVASCCLLTLSSDTDSGGMLKTINAREDTIK